ncbi:MAG TPA: glycosyltransferase family 4 protein [Steroidobacter sp.]|uniref:glycosyltransferase family 4 protein n=1 Tax=Steroidobacter sp. TaxID=1978227 RepID=UPI002ED8D3F1
MRTLTLVLPGDPLTATGGYEYDRRMLEGLRDLGWSTQVVALDSSFPVPTAEALRDAERQLAAFPAGSLVMIDGLALGAMPDLVHAHKDRLCLVGLVHHPLAAETGLAPQLASRLFESERHALRAMRHVVVTSRTTRRALAAYEIASDRIAVAEPGVDQPRINQPRIDQPPVDQPCLEQTVQQIAGSKGQIEGASTPVRMLCVATLTPRKGHDLLMDALAPLSDVNWTLTCVGDITRSPATADALKMRIHAAGWEDRVKVTGEIGETELLHAFRNADLFVLATRLEGYGMAVAQALAHGLPIISTRTGAISELVPPDAGLLVEPDDQAAFSDALSRSLSDADFRRRLTEGARAAGARLPSWSAAARQLSDILGGMTSAHSNSGSLQ